MSHREPQSVENGAAPEAEMQALLAMGAGTCYLHATLSAALEPVIS